ncbi:DUF502 domain-containing protein [Halorubellus salinus]|uniref:DUF502 domain-containing protein n=1 Tax=Halorubellus salinus TaxID=755309 RepID=UPI001D07D221|nr:DUF502 domain-containing protein [Halorubellus salinus]
MSDSDRIPGSGVETAREASQSAYQHALDVLTTGVVTLLPIVVTVYVLDAAFGIIFSVLEPVLKVLAHFGLLSVVQQNVVVAFLVEVGIYESAADFVGAITAFLILVAVVVVVGTVARNRYGERLVDLFDFLFASIPGIGSVYRAFRRMGDAMIESEAENFRSVKLVQYPTEGSYMIAFETATTPANVRGATETAAMRTLFVPLAPNPVMGGFLAHFPEGEVLDVDMSVEEGIQGLVTSGMAMDADGFSPAELREFGLDDDTVAALEDDQPDVDA